MKVSSSQLIAVLGAGGPTGKLCVQQLLDVGARVRAVVRSPANYQGAFAADPALEVVKGDVTDLKSLSAALYGVTGIIFAASSSTYFGAKSVENEGVVNVASTASRTGAHVLLISTALVTPKNRWSPFRILLNTVIRYNRANEKFAGETALRQSGVSYTIVRPSGLFDGPPDKAKLIVEQGDQVGLFPMISRADVAAVCVAALFNPKAKNVTFEVRSDSKVAPGEADLGVLFDGLKTGVFD